MPTPSDPSLGLRRSSRLRNMSDKPLPQLSAIAEEFIPPVHVPVSFCPPIELTSTLSWLLITQKEMIGFWL